MSPEPFRLYNSLTRQIEDFKPIQTGKVSLYVCGNTVSGSAHVGHGRSMVVFDAFVRYLRHCNWSVKFVRNFTDVDDKIIRRAAETGETPMELAERFIKAYQTDTSNLGLMPPDAEPRVSQSIPQIIGFIEKLITQEHAYVSDGSVWFKVSSFPEYGKLSKQKVDELRSADDASGKESAADFALWKAVKPEEPSWPSPWGAGRPGWHIECSAMSGDCLGPQLDIHGGGIDLIFPHHENEIAQSECANGSKYVNYWMHHGLLTMKGGQKMGKSLGNVIDIAEALEDFPAEGIRMYFLQNHYRSPLPWSSTALQEALSMLVRLYEAKEAAMQMKGQEKPEVVAASLGEEAQNVLALGTQLQAKIHQALQEDFNTSIALSHCFEVARAINRFASHKKAKKRGGPIVKAALDAFQDFSQSVGLLGMDPIIFHNEVKTKRIKAMGLQAVDIENALQLRQQAREQKEWAKSDKIRDELLAQGIIVMDTPQGVQWRVKL